MPEINIANLWTRAYNFVYGSIRIISFLFVILAENIEINFAKMFKLILYMYCLRFKTKKKYMYINMTIYMLLNIFC
jgi:hypothetical protein